MLCPFCNVDMRLANHQGVEIDYCLQCRGVWLDRGELEKIIERSTEYLSMKTKDIKERSHHGQEYRGGHQGERSHYGQEYRGGHKGERSHHGQEYRRESNHGHGQEYRSNHRGDSNRSDRKRSFLEDLFDF